MLLPILVLAALIPTPTFSREIPSSGDASFVRQALRADLLEEKLAKVALKRVNGAAVRAVAHMILKQDPATTQALRQATHESGLTPPTETEKDMKAQPPRSALSFLAQDVEEKHAVVQLFREEARNGGNPVLRGYAQTHLPLIQAQLHRTELDERRVAGLPPPTKPTGYPLPKPWPSITPMGQPPSTTPPEPEG